VRVDAILAFPVPTVLPRAVINVVLAIYTIPSGSARARVCVDSVHAHTIPTILPRAIINVCSARSSVPSGSALASVRVGAIHAGAVGRARRACAIINVGLTGSSLPPCVAGALKSDSAAGRSTFITCWSCTDITGPVPVAHLFAAPVWIAIDPYIPYVGFLFGS
jgi:hypothetical protein